MRAALLGALLALTPAVAFAQNTTEGRRDLPQQGSAPTPKDAKGAPDTSQRGSRGSTAGGDERTGAPGAGVESGDANGMAGGRTDQGPHGGTGIREGGGGAERERARAKQSGQARGRNRKGSLARPADSPPQINRDPKPAGSGAPMTPVEQEPRRQGRNYVEGPQPGAAGGVATETESTPGGAAPRGPTGKGAQTQPDKKPTDRRPDSPNTPESPGEEPGH
jgi:hypothetical protein